MVRSRNSSLPRGSDTTSVTGVGHSMEASAHAEAEGQDSGAHRKHSAVSSAVIFMVMQMMPLKRLHRQLAGKGLHFRREWSA